MNTQSPTAAPTEDKAAVFGSLLHDIIVGTQDYNLALFCRMLHSTTRSWHLFSTFRKIKFYI